jgi:N-hydroxyarylamine O-acetyltransferase
LPGEWLLERRGPAEATDGRTGSADGEGWIGQFAFDLAEVAEADLAMGNHWSSTHPSARFVNVQVVSLCLADGFAGMVDGRFSLYRKGQPTARREVASADQYRAVLAESFGVRLLPDEVARLPLFKPD